MGNYSSFSLSSFWLQDINKFLKASEPVCYMHVIRVENVLFYVLWIV